MADWIPAWETLTTQAQNIDLPDEEEIEAAARVLSLCPVAGYPPFTEAETLLVGAYLTFQKSLGGYDFVWPSLVNGEPLGWAFAVHEAAELQAFAEMDVNPFDLAAFHAHLPEAHRRAVVQELIFLKAWAAQIGQRTTEAAIERENPIRSLLSQDHSRFVRSLETEQDWPAPSEDEMQAAQEFWRIIGQGEIR